MKKFSLLGLILLFLASCSSWPYAGNWKAQSNGRTYDLNINNDGTISAKWIGTDGQSNTKSGTWENNDDGSITLDGVNAKATATIENDNTLKFKTDTRQLIFTRTSEK